MQAVQLAAPARTPSGAGAEAVAGSDFKGGAVAAALHKYLCELICWGSINQTCNNIYSLKTNYELYRLAALQQFVPLCDRPHCRLTRLLPAGERSQCASCGVCCWQPHANINMNTPWTPLGHTPHSPAHTETRLCVCSSNWLKVNIST